MNSKNAKYNKEEVLFIKDKSDSCEGCKFAEDDVVYEGKVLFRGCDKAVCRKYPEQKPISIMNGKEACEFKK